MGGSTCPEPLQAALLRAATNATTATSERLYTKSRDRYSGLFQLIIGGDFNCAVDFTVDRTSEEPHSRLIVSTVLLHIWW